MKVFVDGIALVESLRENDAQLVVSDSRQKTRENVARWLARYAEHQDCEVELVFENAPEGEVLPPVEKYGPVHVRNLSSEETTLREIAGPANRRSADDRVYVVTEDPRISDAVSSGGVRVFSPQKFISRVQAITGTDRTERYAEPNEKYTGVSEEKVDFWVDFFKEE